MKGAVKEWLNGVTADGYDAGIQKLATGCDKCLNVGGYCLEILLTVCNNDTSVFCSFLFGLFFFIVKRYLLSG